MTEPHFSPEISDDFVKMHEELLVPSIYGQWAHRVADISEIDMGHAVLDVACGTGPLTKAVQLEAGLTGRVVGLDSSDKMLAVAAKKSRGIDWQLGDAEHLPFQTNEFDRVVCQFSMMFIPNRVAAIKEMLRVCKPDGLVVIAIWAQLDHSKAYATLFKLVRKFVGSRAAYKLAAPWTLGNPGVMDRLLLSTEINEYICHERLGVSRFPSMRSFIETHLKLAGEFEDIDEGTYRQLLSAADVDLRKYVVPGGQLVAQLDANVYTINGI